jgi:hypothetical protein
MASQGLGKLRPDPLAVGSAFRVMPGGVRAVLNRPGFFGGANSSEADAMPNKITNEFLPPVFVVAAPISAAPIPVAPTPTPFDRCRRSAWVR